MDVHRPTEQLADEHVPDADAGQIIGHVARVCCLVCASVCVAGARAGSISLRDATTDVPACLRPT